MIRWAFRTRFIPAKCKLICLSFVPVCLTALQSEDHNMPEILYHLREFRDQLLNIFWTTTPTSLVFALYTFYHWCTTISYVTWCFSLKTSNIHLIVLTLKSLSLFPTEAPGLQPTTNWHTTKQQYHLTSTSLEHYFPYWYHLLFIIY